MKYGLAIFADGTVVKLPQVCGITPMGVNSCRVVFHGGGEMRVPCSATDMAHHLASWFESIDLSLKHKPAKGEGTENGPERD